jgi:hypothetical protein
VRAGLLKVKGVLAATYDSGQDIFSIRYEAVMVGLETILAAVGAAGKMMGREYLPEVLPPSRAIASKNQDVRTLSR